MAKKRKKRSNSNHVQESSSQTGSAKNGSKREKETQAAGNSGDTRKKESSFQVKQGEQKEQSKLQSVKNSVDQLAGGKDSMPKPAEKTVSRQKNGHEKDNRAQGKTEENIGSIAKDSRGGTATPNVSPESAEPFAGFSEVDKDYEGETRRKLTPKERFFQACEKFGDLFLLNVFFTITSIPIVTIGASFTALYTVTFKMARNEDTTIKDGYFKAFKRNFKQATELWIALLVVFYLVYLQYEAILNVNVNTANVLTLVLGFELLILTFVVPLLFPLVARYENTNLQMIKNSLLFSIIHLGTWATVFFLWVIPVILYYLRPNLFYYTWYLWLIFLSSFVAYTCSHRLRSMFDLIEQKETL